MKKTNKTKLFPWNSGDFWLESRSKGNKKTSNISNNKREKRRRKEKEKKRKKKKEKKVYRYMEKPLVQNNRIVMGLEIKLKINDNMTTFDF
jgi:hypothetical protein